MELEEARIVVTTLARQLELSEMRGQNTLTEQGGEPWTEEQIRAWARMNRNAIHAVLKAAGLSADWH